MCVGTGGGLGQGQGGRAPSGGGRSGTESMLCGLFCSTDHAVDDVRFV